MAESNLHERLALLQQSLKHTAQLIVRLAKTQSALSTRQPDGESTDSQATLSAEIHDILTQEEEELELLQQDVDDLAPVSSSNSSTSRKASAMSRRANTREREYSRLCATCNKLREELKLGRVRFRRAQLQSKRNTELSLQREQLAYLAELQATAESASPISENTEEQRPSHMEMRNNLLNPNRRAGRGTKNGTQDDVMLTASADLTTSLRRTHDMLTSEVSRSRFAQDTLAASNTALQELNKRYGTLDDMLARSRGLLGSLLRSQKSDTWYLETALCILLVTMGWLLFRRLLYGPAWWLLWQPLRMFWTFTAWLSFRLLGLSGTSRGVLSVDTTAETRVTMPSATVVQYKEKRAGETVDHSAEITETGYQNSEEYTVSSLSVQVGAIVDGTKTGRASNENKATPSNVARQESSDTAGEEKIPAEEQPRKPDQKQSREGMIKRGDGEILQDRDPEENPPNPKKRTWEEVPNSDQKQTKDEL